MQVFKKYKYNAFIVLHNTFAVIEVGYGYG